MRCKKILSSIMVALMLLVLYTPKTEAFGKIVYDPTNEVHFLAQLEELYKQYEQIKLQVDILQYRLKNVESIGDIKAIHDTVTVLLGLQDRSGQLWQVAGMPGEWRRKYPKDEELEKKVLEQNASLDQGRELINETNEAIIDAAQAQGYIMTIKDDELILKDLLNRTTEANATETAKLGNHIAALQIQQLIRMQYILATSLRMQSHIYAHQVQGARVSDLMLTKNQFKDLPAENPLKDGPGEYSGVTLDSDTGS